MGYPTVPRQGVNIPANWDKINIPRRFHVILLAVRVSRLGGIMHTGPQFENVSNTPSYLIPGVSNNLFNCQETGHSSGHKFLSSDLIACVWL